MVKAQQSSMKRLEKSESMRKYGVVTGTLPKDGLAELLRSADRAALHSLSAGGVGERRPRRAFHWYTRSALWHTAVESCERVQRGEITTLEEMNADDLAPLLRLVDKHFVRNPRNIRVKQGVEKDKGPASVQEWFASVELRNYNGAQGGCTFKWYSPAIMIRELFKLGVERGTCSEMQAMVALRETSHRISLHGNFQHGQCQEFAGPQCFASNPSSSFRRCLAAAPCLVWQQDSAVHLPANWISAPALARQFVVLGG